MRTVVRKIDAFPIYDFDATAGYATYNQGRYAADSFEDGVFSRALEIDNEPVAIAIRSDTGTADPGLIVEVSCRSLSESTADRAAGTAVRMVGAHVDPRPFYAAIEDDPEIGPIVYPLRGLGIPQAASAFEAVVLSILGQQISNHVARVIRNLLVETFGRTVTVNGRRLKTFPSPDALAGAGVNGLRGIKFSMRKAEYICGIASAVADGELDLDSLSDLPADEIVNRLVRIRGVGPWTANWLLIRAYGHSDGFPDGDLAIQRILGRLFNNGQRLTARQALELSVRWSPYRSFLTTYLFAAARAGMFEDGRRRSLAGP